MPKYRPKDWAISFRTKPTTIAKSRRPVVIDYEQDGHGSFSASQIKLMKAKGAHKRLRCQNGEPRIPRLLEEGLATKKPAWLERENPDWDGNYKVRYWHPDWQ